jgi:hypothetical protein
MAKMVQVITMKLLHNSMVILVPTILILILEAMVLLHHLAQAETERVAKEEADAAAAYLLVLVLLQTKQNFYFPNVLPVW